MSKPSSDIFTFTPASLAQCADSWSRRVHVRVTPAASVICFRGEVRLRAKRRNDVLAFRAGSSLLKFAQPPFNNDERRAILKVLRMYDPAVELRSMTKWGDRIVLEMFGARHPLSLRNSHTADIGVSLLPASLGAGEAPRVAAASADLF